MNLVGFTMVKNEEDIIEQFIRHNLEYLDKIYIFDHFSTDKTVDIVSSIIEEGLPVFFVKEIDGDFIEYKQSEVMTRMLHFVVEKNGRGIYFPMDADEFIYPKEKDFSSIKDELILRDYNFYFEVFWDGLVIPENPDENYFSDPPKSFNLVQCAGEGAKTQKIVISIENLETVKLMIIEQGNHSICHDGTLKKETIDGLSYLHIPIRSSDQMFRKSISGWLSNVHKYGKSSIIGYHWGLMFKKIYQNGNLTNHDLRDALQHYSGSFSDDSRFSIIDSQSIFKYNLKYSHLRVSNMHAVLTDLEERFASLHANSMRKNDQREKSDVEIFQSKIVLNIGGIGEISVFPAWIDNKESMSFEIKESGCFEIFMTSIFARFINMTHGGFIDAGAEIGWYSYIAAKISPHHPVFSFEEDYRNYPALKLGSEMNHLKNMRVRKYFDSEYINETSEENGHSGIKTIRIGASYNNMKPMDIIDINKSKFDEDIILIISTKFMDKRDVSPIEKYLLDNFKKINIEKFFVDEANRSVTTINDAFWTQDAENISESRLRKGNVIFATIGSNRHAFLKSLSQR